MKEVYFSLFFPFRVPRFSPYKNVVFSTSCVEYPSVTITCPHEY